MNRLPGESDRMGFKQWAIVVGCLIVFGALAFVCHSGLQIQTEAQQRYIDNYYAKIHEEGRQAAASGLPVSANPYIGQSNFWKNYVNESREWTSGYSSAGGDGQ